jgi:ABC-type nitrate/sulfonate/bicarbonate transport system substrate-binding protein
MAKETKRQTNTKSPRKSNFITAIRSQKNPAVAALISRGTTPDGFSYLYFELSRAWKASTGNVGYSTKLYERNQDALIEVIAKAAEWIRENPDAADGFAEKTSAEPAEIQQAA